MNLLHIETRMKRLKKKNPHFDPPHSKDFSLPSEEVWT
jgi:hypothetical protein